MSMKFAVRLSLFAASFITAFAQQPAHPRMVVVISLDGLPANALEDPRLPIPTLRRLTHDGVSARMTPINPAVTWPNHTAMVTGVRASEHGVLANGTIVQTGAWPPVRLDNMVDKEQMVHVPTVYDAAHQAGLTTAQIDWVAINRAPGITWPVSEWPLETGPVEQEMIRKGIIAATDLKDFAKANILFRDQFYATAAEYLIREHKPNLVLAHFVALDSVQHQYGPGNLAATSAVAFVDSCVARMLDAIQASGLQNRTTVIVLSDHGFKKYTKEIHPAIALAAAGLGNKAYVLPVGGSGYVYFDSPQAAEVAPQVKHALEGVEGIERITGPDGLPALGFPEQGRDPQMFRMLLTAKAGYVFTAATSGPVTTEAQGGNHGYPVSDPEMESIFIASGYGVRAGAQLEKFPNIDVASTIADLLGVRLPTAKGKVIPIH
jgi:predicted AlkP superfamily pyrophosphatase or phosphodiesterase